MALEAERAFFHTVNHDSEPSDEFLFSSSFGVYPDGLGCRKALRVSAASVLGRGGQYRRLQMVSEGLQYETGRPVNRSNLEIPRSTGNNVVYKATLKPS